MGRLGNLYRYLHGVGLGRPMNFSWFEDMIAASGRPSSIKEVEWLWQQGLRTMLSLTEKALPNEWIKGHDWHYLHVSMIDHCPPTIEQLDSATNFITKAVGMGKPLLVHCDAGIGRTGTVLASYLVRSKGFDAIKAIAFVRNVRPRSIEHIQEDAVVDYHRHIKGGVA